MKMLEITPITLYPKPRWPIRVWTLPHGECWLVLSFLIKDSAALTCWKLSWSFHRIHLHLKIHHLPGSAIHVGMVCYKPNTRENIRCLTKRTFAAGTSRHPRYWIVAIRTVQLGNGPAHFVGTRDRCLPNLWLYKAAIVRTAPLCWGGGYPSKVFFAMPCTDEFEDILDVHAHIWWASSCSTTAFCTVCTWPCWTIHCPLHIGKEEERHPFLQLKTEVSVSCTSHLWLIM